MEEEELSDTTMTMPHKKRASSWATLQDLANDAAAAEDTLDWAVGARRKGRGNEVDMRKTTSSPALQQVFSHHHRGASTPSASAAAAAPAISSSTRGVPAGALRVGGGNGGSGAATVPPETSVLMPSGLGGWNAAAATAAAADSFNPLQLASSMSMDTSVDRNFGVNMGLNMARLGRMGLSPAGRWAALQLQPGRMAAFAGGGEGLILTPRSNSTSELQDVADEEQGEGAILSPAAAGGGGDGDGGLRTKLSPSGSDKMVGGGVGFDAAETIGGALFQGHPSVEPIEGSLKRPFKSCPNFVQLGGGAGGLGFGGGGFGGGGALVKTDAMAVENKAGGGGGGVNVGLLAGRSLYRADPMALRLDEGFEEEDDGELTPAAAAAAASSRAGVNLARSNLSVIQQRAAASAAAAVAAASPKTGSNPTPQAAAAAGELNRGGGGGGGIDTTTTGSPLLSAGGSVSMECDPVSESSLAVPSAGRSGRGLSAGGAATRGGGGGQAAAMAAAARPAFSSGVKMMQSSIKPVTSCPSLGELGRATVSDDRRSRRLERNRASARVRRQRKKSMAELYEKEVARLERCIATLRMHAWGGGGAEAAALAEALGQPREGTEGMDARDGGLGGGAAYSAALPEEERGAARDQAAASVEEHLKGIALGALDAHAIALAIAPAPSPRARELNFSPCSFIAAHESRAAATTAGAVAGRLVAPVSATTAATATAAVTAAAATSAAAASRPMSGNGGFTAALSSPLSPAVSSLLTPLPQHLVSVESPPLTPPSVGVGPTSARLGTAEVTIATAAAAAAAATTAAVAAGGGMPFEARLKAGGGEGGVAPGIDFARGVCGRGGGVGAGIETAAAAVETRREWPPPWGGNGDGASRSSGGNNTPDFFTHPRAQSPLPQMDSPDSTDWWDVLDVSVDGPGSALPAPPTASTALGAAPIVGGNAAAEGREGGAGGLGGSRRLSGSAAATAKQEDADVAVSEAIEETGVSAMERIGVTVDGVGRLAKDKTRESAAAAALSEGTGFGADPRGGRAPEGSWEAEKARSLREAVRLREDQALALAASSDQWEDELLVAMVLSKVSSALRTPAKMDMPAMQEAARAFETLTSDDQHSKFRSWVDSNMEAVAHLDHEPPSPRPPPPAAAAAAAASPSTRLSHGNFTEGSEGSGAGAFRQPYSPSSVASPPAPRTRSDGGGGGLTSFGERAFGESGGGSTAGGVPTVTAGAITQGHQSFPSAAAAAPGPGTGAGTGTGTGRSWGRKRASPQFTFRGQDGSVSGSEEGGDGREGPGAGRGKGAAGAVSFALAMDQSQ